MLRRILLTFSSLALLAAPALAQEASSAPLQDVPVAAPDAPPAPKATALPTVVNSNPAVDPDNVLLLYLSNGGKVTIRLMPEWAPNHIERIKTLARQGFYNGLVFHRVIDGFMAQTGDPTGTGASGSDLPDLKAEFNAMPHLRGTVSMARTNEPDTANSQFFIVFYPRMSLDRKYTNFGRVISGMDAVDAITRGEPPENPTKIVQAAIAADNAPAPAMAAGPVVATPSVKQLNNSQPN